MHPAAVREEARALAAEGENDCEIARRTGLPRTTIRDWRVPRYQPRGREICPRCWRPAKPLRFTDDDYAELLGLYLGDGHIVRAGRTHRLRLFMDSAHPEMLDDIERLLARCFPGNAVKRVRAEEGRMTVLSVYSVHMPCLFPQHGPGRKHERSIALEPWQRLAVERAPWGLLRGLIRSDGCVYLNRTGRYEYLSYAFENRSDDLLNLFCEACDLAGVARRRNSRAVRIYRRESVRAFVQNVGYKR